MYIISLRNQTGEDPGHVGETTCLGWPGNALEEVAGDRDIWVSLLKLLPPRPDPRRSGR